MREYLRLSEAAEYLDVCPRTVGRWIDSGIIDGIRTLTGERRVCASAVTAALLKRNGATAPAPRARAHRGGQ